MAKPDFRRSISTGLLGIFLLVYWSSGTGAAVALDTITVTVETNPPGLFYVVDLHPFMVSHSFAWTVGCCHQIGTDSLQGGGFTGRRFVWTGWSDGGERWHNIAVGPGLPTTYTANFITQYQLTVNAGTGGTVTPATNYHDAGQDVQISATPSSGYVFVGWTGTGPGSYTGPNNPATVSMNGPGPITESAVFARLVTQTDLALDFGSQGLWALYNDSIWEQIHSLNPSLVATGDIDGNGEADVIMDFPGLGVWARLNKTVWTRIHGLDASGMATGDFDGNGKSDVLLNFGADGVYVYLNNSSWVYICAGNPDTMLTGDLDGDGKSEAVLNFSPAGVYRWNFTSGLTQIHALAASSLAVGNLDGAGGEDLLAGFPGYGVYMLSGATWTFINPSVPSRMVIADIDNIGPAEAIFNFEGSGVWQLTNLSAWTQLHPLQTGLLATGDLDNNGKADVLMTFEGSGLWARMNGVSYVLLTPLVPEAVAFGKIDAN